MLFLREWYMHPNGQMPAYEFAFGDVNPPVHAWACWRVYKMTGAARRSATALFLARVFQKLLLNFTWWVNRKDAEGKHLFAGGFLGLDNIGVFDRSQPLPGGGHLEQADGTAWMAFYCATMLSMALELAQRGPGLRGHRLQVLRALRRHRRRDEHARRHRAVGRGGRLLLRPAPRRRPARPAARALDGRLIPLFAVEVLEDDVDRAAARLRQADALVPRQPPRPGAPHRLHGAPTAATATAPAAGDPVARAARARAALPARRERVPLAVRHPLAVARPRASSPYVLRRRRRRSTASTTRRASRDTGLFGGNSNWRGPVWFPVNYLLIEALERYHHFYGDALQGRVPDRLGPAAEPARGGARARRAAGALFLPDANGRRPCHGDDARYAERSALARPRAVPRVLPRRHRPRRRRQPPDRLDRAGGALHRGARHAPRARSRARPCEPALEPATA